MTPEQFRQYLYAGGANDQQATERILTYGAENGLNAEQLVSLTNSALGTKFTPADLERAVNESTTYGSGSAARAANVTTTFDAAGNRKSATAPTAQDIALVDQLLSPDEFRKMIYAGGVNDSVATERLLKYGAENQMTADQLTALTNAALGTKFTNADLARAVDNSIAYGKGSVADASKVTTTFDASGNRINATNNNATNNNATNNNATNNNATNNNATNNNATNNNATNNNATNNNATNNTVTQNNNATKNNTVTQNNTVTGTGGATNLLSPDAFRRYIYAGGANDQVATERIFQYMLDNNLSFDQILSLTNSALGTSFSMSDLTKALRGSSVLGNSSSATAPNITTTFDANGNLIPYDSPEYRAARQFDIKNTPVNVFTGADQVGGLSPTFLFNPDEQYQSGLIKGLRSQNPMGFNNPGFTLLKNATNSDPLVLRQTQSGLNQNNPGVDFRPTMPPRGDTSTSNTSTSNTTTGSTGGFNSAVGGAGVDSTFFNPIQSTSTGGLNGGLTNGGVPDYRLLDRDFDIADALFLNTGPTMEDRNTANQSLIDTSAGGGVSNFELLPSDLYVLNQLSGIPGAETQQSKGINSMMVLQ